MATPTNNPPAAETATQGIAPAVDTNILKHLVDEIYIHGEELFNWTKRDVEILLALIARRHIEKSMAALAAQQKQNQLDYQAANAAAVASFAAGNESTVAAVTGGSANAVGEKGQGGNANPLAGSQIKGASADAAAKHT